MAVTNNLQDINRISRKVRKANTTQRIAKHLYFFAVLCEILRALCVKGIHQKAVSKCNTKISRKALAFLRGSLRNPSCSLREMYLANQLRHRPYNNPNGKKVRKYKCADGKLFQQRVEICRVLYPAYGY